jgi:hypothetical protein
MIYLRNLKQDRLAYRIAQVIVYGVSIVLALAFVYFSIILMYAMFS